MGRTIRRKKGKLFFKIPQEKKKCRKGGEEGELGPQEGKRGGPSWEPKKHKREMIGGRKEIPRLPRKKERKRKRRRSEGTPIRNSTLIKKDRRHPIITPKTGKRGGEEKRSEKWGNPDNLLRCRGKRKYPSPLKGKEESGG